MFLKLDWDKKDLVIDEEYRYHPIFAEVAVLIAINAEELHEQINYQTNVQYFVLLSDACKIKIK